MGRYDCFILRIWRSEGEHGEQWAGRIEHVSGTEHIRFNDPEALLHYLRERFAPGEGGSSRYPRGGNEEEDSANEPEIGDADS
jgi:hypothetical protein